MSPDSQHMEYILLAVEPASPFQYFLLFCGLAFFAYLAYRHVSASSNSLKNLLSFSSTRGYRRDSKNKGFSGEINGYPFTFSQVVERGYGSTQRFVKLKVNDIPGAPHIEGAVKTKIGYGVVHTIWNKPPFATLGKLALFSHDEHNARILLSSGLGEILEPYSENNLQLLMADSSLIITSSELMKDWKEEDIQEALSLASSITNLLKCREAEGQSYR